MFRGDTRRRNPQQGGEHAHARGVRVVLVALAVMLAGCYQQMSDQPRYDPLERSDLFSDQMAARDLVPGVVTRGHQPNAWVEYSSHFLTGVVDGESAETLPSELLERWNSEAEILERGRERYRVYCSHCHDLTGSGQGFVPRRGYPSPPTFHSERLREVPIGHFYRVITNGFGRMPAHAAQVSQADRWAIAAYIRALQLSQHFSSELLEASDREALETNRE